MFRLTLGRHLPRSTTAPVTRRLVRGGRRRRGRPAPAVARVFRNCRPEADEAPRGDGAYEERYAFTSPSATCELGHRAPHSGIVIISPLPPIPSPVWYKRKNVAPGRVTDPLVNPHSSSAFERRFLRASAHKNVY